MPRTYVQNTVIKVEDKDNQWVIDFKCGKTVILAKVKDKEIKVDDIVTTLHAMDGEMSTPTRRVWLNDEVYM